MDFKKLLLGEKIILASGLLSIISLFMPWVTLGIFSENGLEQQGYIVLLALIYPLVQAFRQKKANKAIAAAAAALGIVFMIYFIGEKSASLFGVKISAAGSGMYVMIVALVGTLIGVLINNRGNEA